MSDKRVDLLEDEYNNAPYQSFAFSQTHPTHLYTLAKLFGLNPPPVEKAKVLELGCASGGNLIPMAFHYPNAEFLGIDLADKQVVVGQKIIQDMNLKNIHLEHKSISDFTPKDGKFDYIICHGVYSWVSDEVREDILKICHENLNQNGIAYVSYNTFPGWNMVNSVRDMMFWHTKNIQDPPTRAKQARSLLKFITDGLQDDRSPYAMFLKGEIAVLSKHPDSYLLHDHLSSFNQPVYFYQFMEAANKQQLSYLSDAHLATMYTDNLPPQFSNELKKVNNIIVIGQYMDYIRNQRFRSTLLCHQDVQVNRALKTNDIENHYLQFIGKPSEPNFNEKGIQEGIELTFTHGPISLKVKNKISQMALLVLYENRFKPIHYNELCDKVMTKTQVKDLSLVKKHLNDDLNILRCAFAGLMNLFSYAPIYTLEVSEKPVACPLARYLATVQNYVTNRRHEPVNLDPVAKVLLPHLDGTKSHQELEKFIEAELENGNLKAFDKDKNPIQDKNEIKKQVALFCKSSLENMAKQALLISG